MPTVTQEAPWTTINTYSNVDSFYPDGQWKPTRMLTQARCDWELAVEIGAIDMVPTIQFTNDVTDPSTFVSVAVGSRQTATGVYPPTGYSIVGATAEAKRYFRTGWQAKSVTDANHASARVGGMWDLFFE